MAGPTTLPVSWMMLLSMTAFARCGADTISLGK